MHRPETQTVAELLVAEVVAVFQKAAAGAYLDKDRPRAEVEQLLRDGLEHVGSTRPWPGLRQSINWRYRQYRCASLSFVYPGGAIPKLGTPAGYPPAVATRRAATVQHQTWELEKTFASGQGSDMSIRVKCYEQAGGLSGRTVDYAVAVSLWVAPSLNVDLYSQPRNQIAARVAVRPQ